MNEQCNEYATFLLIYTDKTTFKKEAHNNNAL